MIGYRRITNPESRITKYIILSLCLVWLILPQAVCLGATYYVDGENGNDSNPGTIDQPLATLEAARDAIRELKSTTGLPSGGVTVWIRGGVYERETTFQLSSEDSGESDKPIIYRAYPNEEIRIIGASKIDPSWFEPVTEASPVWDRLDQTAQGNLMQIDLTAHGITNYGTIKKRAGWSWNNNAALELFFNQEPMQLARWPNKDDNDDEVTYNDDVITIYGNPTPDVSGTYVKNGTQDGVNSYMRQGLVDGKQYYLHRYYWEYPVGSGTFYRAWFLATRISGYGGGTDPWWSRYNPQLGDLNPYSATGTVGTATTIDPARISSNGRVIVADVPDEDGDGQPDRYGYKFVYAGERPQRWDQAEEVWFSGLWKYYWFNAHAQAAAIETTTKTVTLSDSPTYGLDAGMPYYAYNLLEEIDTPGEWYLNRDTGILYFWPPSDLTEGETYVSLIEDFLLRLENVEYVTFKGIIFEMSRASLVYISGGSHNILENCTLRNTGVFGVRIRGSYHGIEGCTIHDLGEDAILISGGDRTNLTSSYNFISNNNIYHWANWVSTSKNALRCAWANNVGHLISHNLMHDAPNGALWIYGNDHLIEYNEIHNVCTQTSDAGAVYSGRRWDWQGNVFRYNFIHHIYTTVGGYGVHGLYLDDNMAGWRVYGNVFYDIENNALMHGGGWGNIFENNIIAKSNRGLYTDQRGVAGSLRVTEEGTLWTNLIATDYQNPPRSERYPALAVVPNEFALLGDYLRPLDCVFVRNIGWSNSSFAVEAYASGESEAGDHHKSFYYFAEFDNNEENHTPLFDEEVCFNRSLRPEYLSGNVSGFEPIPFSKIGIENNIYGDVSGNGEVSAYDASLAAQYAVGLISLTAEQITAADVSGNEEVSAYDVSLIAQYVVGLIDRFPVEQ